MHAKLCIIDDEWAKVGSDNINRARGPTTPNWPAPSSTSPRKPHPGDGDGSFARDLRLRLAREHLDRAAGDDGDLLDPRSFFDAFAAPPPGWKPGIRAADADPAPPDVFGRFLDLVCHVGAGYGRPRSTAPYTTRTDGLDRGVRPAGTEANENGGARASGWRQAGRGWVEPSWTPIGARSEVGDEATVVFRRVRISDTLPNHDERSSPLISR